MLYLDTTIGGCRSRSHRLRIKQESVETLMSGTDEQPLQWVINTDRASFQDDVLTRSQRTPVVVDFWAAWCAPCRALAPILEKLSYEYGGKFTLVKANTEEVPEAASQFGVQGIPAIFGVIDGEIVDFFSGALPEQDIRGWLDRLLSVNGLAEAARLEEDDPNRAERRYRELADQIPTDSAPRIGLARVLLAQDKVAEAQSLVDELSDRGYLEPEAEKIKAGLDLRGKNDDHLEEHRAAAEAAPDDLQLQHQLAVSLAGAQQYEECLEICLKLVERDRQVTGEEARKLMIEIFCALPDDSELTTTYRRRLSLALY